MNEESNNNIQKIIEKVHVGLVIRPVLCLSDLNMMEGMLNKLSLLSMCLNTKASLYSFSSSNAQ